MRVASREGTNRRAREREVEKKFEKSKKTFQKGLDKAKVMWYNSQAVPRGADKNGH